jgi:hypothetical protein
MYELLTISEIRSRFDGEWVLVEEPELDENSEVVRGRVLWHSQDRDEVYQRAIELRPKHSAFLYVGRMPEGTAIIL